MKLDVDSNMHNDRDRYSDIATYFKSAVKLRTGDKSDKWGNYINACYINSPMSSGSGTGDGKIIASQGPLPQTTGHFWQMLIEQNVDMIISTCKTVEQGRKKCNQFWPNQDKPFSFSLAQEDGSTENYKISLASEVQESSNLMRREIMAAKEDGTQ